jgi:hypothetical protein
MEKERTAEQQLLRLSFQIIQLLHLNNTQSASLSAMAAG